MIAVASGRVPFPRATDSTHVSETEFEDKPDADRDVFDLSNLEAITPDELRKKSS